MPHATPLDPAYRGNNPRPTEALHAWLARALPEPVLDPRLPIVDAHHHLYGAPGDTLYYRMEELGADLASGHAMLGTVYVEAYQAGWRTTGPQALRPVGEVERIVQVTRTQPLLAHGPCQVAAGIVSHVDLQLGDGVLPVLQAQQVAAEGRLRGVRHVASHDQGSVGGQVAHLPAAGLLAKASWRQAVAQVGALGLSVDVCVYHHQLPEVLALVDALPDVRFVLNHVGQVLGVAEHRRHRASIYAGWLQQMRALAERPNVWLKVGGLGMPMSGFGFEYEERPATSAELSHAWQPLIDGSIETFGPQRCMFETNAPVDKQSAPYMQMWNAFKRCTRHLAEDERRALFYRTACTVYSLPELKALGDGMTAA